MRKRIDIVGVIKKATQNGVDRWQQVLTGFLALAFFQYGFQPLASGYAPSRIAQLPLFQGMEGFAAGGSGGFFLFLAAIIGIIYWVVSIYMGLGFNHIALSAAREGEPKIGQLYPSLKKFQNYLIGVVIFTLFCLATGLIFALIFGGYEYAKSVLLVSWNQGIADSTTLAFYSGERLGVIGWIFSIAFGLLILWAYLRYFLFYPFVIIDYNLDPLAAFQRAGAISSGGEMGLLLYFVAAVVLFIVSVFLLTIPLLVVIPVLTITAARIYDQFKKAQKLEENQP